MEQKTAIVIGASTGIGAATAEALAQQYKKIAITSFRHPEKLKEVQQKILAQGTDCYAEIGDAGDFTFVRQFIEHVIEHFGKKIDLLVNNAGISYVGLLTDMDETDCDFMKEISEHILSDHGFTLCCKDSILYGVCDECSKKEKKQKNKTR